MYYFVGAPGRSLKMLRSPPPPNPPPPNPPALNISVSHNASSNTQSSPSSFTSESSHTSSSTSSSSTTSNSTISNTIAVRDNAPTSSSNNDEPDAIMDTGQIEKPELIITEPDTSTVPPTTTGLSFC